MTATGAENLGDELITLCEIQRFQREKPDIAITLFSHDPSRTWRFLRTQNIQKNTLEILPYFPTHIRKHPLKNIVYFFKTLSVLYRSSHVYI